MIAGDPQTWQAGWFHAAPFSADPRIPAETRAWISPAITPDLPSYIWWAEASAGAGFLMIYHQLTAEIGFWLSPALRGRNRAAMLLRRGLGHLPADKNTLVLATVKKDNPTAEKAAMGAGMRVMARQEDRVVLCLYRNSPA